MQGQLEGQQVGRYLIRRRLGGGGVASVYQAYDQVSGQSVALKVLPPNPDPATLDRFRREALMAGALHHPHIVRILQVGTAAGGSSAYIAMDLVEGESLADLLARYGQLSAEESCSLLEPVARGLAFAHRNGVIHRDVKPSNILLRPVNVRSEKQSPATIVNLETLPYAVVPLLSDFGIARFLDAPELTNAGRTVGTPAFMAPEQCMGSREVDGRADIYSLGTVLYRCVTGRLPFNGSTTQILHAHVFEPVVIDEATARMLPEQVVAILQRTLAKAPEDRYQSADALADDLHAASHSAALPQPAFEAEVGATSTMTLAQVEVTPRAVSQPVKVLVAGSHDMATPSGKVADEKAAGRRSGPRWERVLWAGLFVLLIGGGGLWSARTWLPRLSEPEGEELLLPPVVLVTFTPTPEEPAGPSEASAATGVAAVVGVTLAAALDNSPMPAAAPTLPPQPAATPQPTVVPSPMPLATQVQLVAPTATPVSDVPTPVSDTPAPAATATPEEALAGTCAMVVDTFILPHVAQLSGELQADFACPTAPARIVNGEWLPFERGVMVALEGEPLVFVYYENGTWEQVARSEQALPPDAPAVIPLPFGQVLASEGRSVLLGEPLQNAPQRDPTYVQPFLGGMALGNQSGDYVLFLARAKLRF